MNHHKKKKEKHTHTHPTHRCRVEPVEQKSLLDWDSFTCITKINFNIINESY